MHYVYILYSKKLNRYYTGQSSDPEQRLLQHNDAENNKNWTRKGLPWESYLTIVCESKRQAMQIEHYIKKMKSRKYIEGLKADPSLINELLKKFSADC